MSNNNDIDITNACKVLRERVQNDKVIYDAFVKCVESILDSNCVTFLPFDEETNITLAEKIINGIFGIGD